ncbi:Gfo/Idh/MocA family protein [Acuticoccus mangrovi]|uniref:Gfo/Idh/MocA family oxidoreductase n=1 Tax=Acuticoccus mangrovi TaxID=2796142 RepID=A0A934IPI0_9HYPH|nr:Gfo/Idh/MocA family oxidoreductase [Acuticoccus mangrovi]MBJ3776198.1 Gfo/Idh/MocA family oxidoreductase [Acuticoccus mangrovi]
MKVIHVGVIGAGSFGRHHVRHLSQHPSVAKVTVVDRSPERAHAAADPVGADVARHAGDLALDAAVIAAPTEFHKEIASDLLERGVPVFVEKPIAATDEEARFLVDLARRKGLVLQVGHIERFSPAFETLAASVSGVRHIAARRHNLPRPTPPVVDVVLDLMIHDIDLVMRLAGAPVAAVAATACDESGRESVSAHLTFRNGVAAEVSASRLSPATDRTLTVHAANGVWRADLVAKRLDRCHAGSVTEVALGDPRDNLQTELDEFVRAVLGEVSPRVDGAAGAAALAVCNTIRANLATPLLLTA